MNSRCSRRLRAGAVVDAVNAICDLVDDVYVTSYIARAARQKLAETAPHVPWVVDRRGRLDVTECSTARMGDPNTVGAKE